MKDVIKVYETKYLEIAAQAWNPIRNHVKMMEEN
jgi:hypothetical protein